MAESEKITEEIVEKSVQEMSEVEKLDAGLEYNFWDEGVNARKLHAVEGCAKLNAIPVTEDEARDAAIRELFGSVGANPTVLPTFSCDNGRNIYVGENFLANYNVTILDIAPVHIGDYVMIGPNTLITTVGQPRDNRPGRLDRQKRHDSARRDNREQRRDRGRRRGQ